MSGLAMDDRGVIVKCGSCKARNRIPFGAGEARCSKCKSALPLPNEPIEVPSVAAFDALIRESKLPVVVDFWAPWCGPCHMVAPEIAKVAAQNAGKVVVVKVNTDALPELGERYSVRSIPTMAVFREGREAARTAGARPAAAIEEFIRTAA